MKEIEILFWLKESIIEAKQKLADIEEKGEVLWVDKYYTHEAHPELQPTKTTMPLEWLRIRQKGEAHYLTYKRDHLLDDGTWKYSDEHESKIGSPEQVTHILISLGFTPLVTVKNRKHTFENEEYEIVLEDVKKLGIFLEVEALNPRASVEEERKKIQSFVKGLGLHASEELNKGKPELLLEKSRKP